MRFPIIEINFKLSKLRFSLSIIYLFSISSVCILNVRREKTWSIRIATNIPWLYWSAGCTKASVDNCGPYPYRSEEYRISGVCTWNVEWTWLIAACNCARVTTCARAREGGIRLESKLPSRKAYLADYDSSEISTLCVRSSSWNLTVYHYRQ